ncbi:MAG: ABC transporter ATP-binding protein, partial [Alphaproteobacteria bacterium]|nr:ABC transporter ATP-binding protein [Alphaproteobacteria bacterium]
VVEPETLLLDEPLSNLDANLREEMRFEIRRLHDEYRYTTVYVTHDQAEAMTAADLIVVMNQGRIEQSGSPQDIYRQPRSEFVARFIGGANILKGRRVGADAIDCDGVVLRCGGGEFAPSGDAALAIRFHDVELTEATAAAGVNETSGLVARQIYLGSHRDYLIELANKQQLRVTAPPEIEFAPGRQVGLRLPPERCRALAH